MVKYITVKTGKRTEFVDITSEVRSALRESAVSSGMCVIYVPHTTAAVTINEGADPSVRNDIINTLNKTIPHHMNYTHLEGNSDAHIKSSLIGASVTLVVDEGNILLGSWQAVFFCEFDGPRHRRVALKFISDQ